MTSFGPVSDTDMVSATGKLPDRGGLLGLGRREDTQAWSLWKSPEEDGFLQETVLNQKGGKAEKRKRVN